MLNTTSIVPIIWYWIHTKPWFSGCLILGGWNYYYIILYYSHTFLTIVFLSQPCQKMHHCVPFPNPGQKMHHTAWLLVSMTSLVKRFHRGMYHCPRQLQGLAIFFVWKCLVPFFLSVNFWKLLFVSISLKELKLRVKARALQLKMNRGSKAHLQRLGRASVAKNVNVWLRGSTMPAVVLSLQRRSNSQWNRSPRSCTLSPRMLLPSFCCQTGLGIWEALQSCLMVGPLHNCVLFFVCSSPQTWMFVSHRVFTWPPKTTLNQTCLDFRFVFFTGSCNWVRKDWKGWAHEWWRCSWWWAWSGEETRRRTVMNFFPCDESPWVWKRTIFLLSNVSQSVREQLQEAKLRARVMRIQLPTLRLMQSCGTSDTGFSVPSWSQAVTWRPGGGVQPFVGILHDTCYVSLFILGFWFHENFDDITWSLLFQVRPLSIFFEPSTVYGTREGYHSALMITSQEPSQPLFEEPSLQVRCCSQCEHAAKVSHLNLEIILIKFPNLFWFKLGSLLCLMYG